MVKTVFYSQAWKKKVHMPDTMQLINRSLSNMINRRFKPTYKTRFLEFSTQRKGYKAKEVMQKTYCNQDNVEGGLSYKH